MDCIKGYVRNDKEMELCSLLYLAKVWNKRMRLERERCVQKDKCIVLYAGVEMFCFHYIKLMTRTEHVYMNMYIWIWMKVHLSLWGCKY